jgi:outer membrane protein assembly factor BamB
VRTFGSAKRLVPVFVLGLGAVACHGFLGKRTAANKPETGPPASAPEVDSSGESPELVDGVDITKKVSGWSLPGARLPSTDFRAGHVTKRTLDAKALSKSRDGWRAELPSHAPITTPAIHGGKVLASGGFHSRQVFAFAAKTGALEWGLDLDDDGPSAPACEDDICVFNTESCTVFAVQLSTGELLWAHWLGDPLTSAPAIAHGKVFTSYPAANGPDGATHAIAAFDLKRGKVLWTRWIDADVMSSPVAHRDALYFTSFAGTVYKLDQASGAVRGARQARATSAPTIVGSSIFYTKRTDDAKPGTTPSRPAEAVARVASKGGYTASSKPAPYLDHAVQGASKLAASGKSLDSSNGFGTTPSSANAGAATLSIGQSNVSTMQTFQGSRIVSVAGASVNVMGDEIIASEIEGGRERWKHKLGGNMQTEGGHLAAAPLAVGRSILVATLEGEVLRLDAGSGKIVARWPLKSPVRSQPIVHDGWIYVGTEDGHLVAIDTGDRSLHGWVAWGGDAARSGVAR